MINLGHRWQLRWWLLNIYWCGSEDIESESGFNELGRRRLWTVLWNEIVYVDVIVQTILRRMHCVMNRTNCCTRWERTVSSTMFRRIPAAFLMQSRTFWCQSLQSLIRLRCWRCSSRSSTSRGSLSTSSDTSFRHIFSCRLKVSICDSFCISSKLVADALCFVIYVIFLPASIHAVLIY